MAYINVDEVYILDNTGLQVDMATDIPFADAGFSDDQKAQARKNIAAGGSNRNLLDNWYFVGGGSQLGDGHFPINQKGQTSYTTAQVTIDRWTLFGGSVVLAADGITVTSSPDFGQVFEPSRLPVGTYTASVKTADGKIGSITFTTTGSQFFAGGAMGDTGVTLNFIDFWTPDKSLFSLQCQGVKIAAAKLEEGTVSTLPNDPPPDFGEELRKCQRRLFIHDFANGDIIADGFAVSASYSVCSLVLPVSMASDGTLTGTVTANPLIYGGGTGEQVSSFSVSAVKGNYAKITVATTVMPANTSVTLYANTNIRLTISKEL